MTGHGGSSPAQPTPRSSQRRNPLGVAVTTIWVGASIGIVVAGDWASLELADWGTFLSGVAAPVAFLWLVLGYYQQQEELRLNTQALDLQREEMRRQADQLERQALQAERQAAAAEALEARTRASLEEERTRRLRDAQPLFVHRGGSVSENLVELDVENHGAGNAWYPRVLDSPNGTIVELDQRLVVRPSARSKLRVRPKPRTLPFRISIGYWDDAGEKRRAVIEFIESGSFLQVGSDLQAPPPMLSLAERERETSFPEPPRPGLESLARAPR